MKRYKIVFDKKIEGYILAYLAAGLFNILLVRVSYDFNETLLSLIFSFSIILGGIGLFLNYLMLSDVRNSFVIDEECLKHGTWGLKKVLYNSITDITYGKNITLVCGSKNHMIKVINLNENKEIYTEILKTIKEKAALEFDLEDALNKLEYNSNYGFRQDGVSLRLNSWLVILYINMIIVMCFTGLYTPLALFAALFAPSMQALGLSLGAGIFFALSLFTVVFMSRRSTRALSCLKRFYAIAAVLVTSGLFINLIINFSSNTVFSYLNAVTSASSQIILVLIVFRYLDISKRVEYTFIYQFKQPASYLDRSIDPGFKLFSKEPASVYGILNWIVMPIVVIIFIFAVIAVSLASLI